MKGRSLSSRLMTGGILPVLIPIAVIGSFSVSKASKSLQNVSREAAVTLAEDLANTTQPTPEEELKRVKYPGVSNSVVPALEKMSTAGVEGASVELDAPGAMPAPAVEESGGAYEGVIVLDKTGLVICDGACGKTKGIELGDRSCFQAVTQDSSSVSNAVRSKLTGNVIAPVCAPVFSSSGKFLGAVVYVTDIDDHWR